jgi:hypothetical protein
MDGGPLDGSRAIYFNAIRLDWTINPVHRLTGFYCNQTEIDELLPVIQDQEQALIEQPEEGIGLYYVGSLYDTQIDAYYIRKNVDSNEVIAIQSSINTFGARLHYSVGRSLDFVGEGAHQFGKRNDLDRSAWGGYGYLELKPAWPQPRFFLPHSVVGGIIYLSGDDPTTRRWEDWDPLFARWPKWSESYIYTQIKEDQVAYWTNLLAFYGQLRLHLSAGADLLLDYYHLRAPERAEADSDFPGGQGLVRGNLFIGKLSFRFDEHWSGHILWEGMAPGDYYFDSADSYSWLRTEMMYTW